MWPRNDEQIRPYVWRASVQQVGEPCSFCKELIKLDDDIYFDKQNRPFHVMHGVDELEEHNA